MSAENMKRRSFLAKLLAAPLVAKAIVSTAEKPAPVAQPKRDLTITRSPCITLNGVKYITVDFADFGGGR